MEQLYGADSLICIELKTIRRGLHINIPLEEMLADFGERSHCEDILQFAEVFGIAKRSGGNLAEIIRSSAELIGRKAEVRQEMDTLLAGKRMELGIMRVMKNKIPKSLYAMCLHRLYVSDTEGVTMETLIDAFAGVDRADIMYESDLEKYNAFPDKITIYRGTENSNEENPRLSWSLLEDVARIFATAHMFKATISKEDVIAYFSKGGDEEEILAVVNEFEKLY